MAERHPPTSQPVVADPQIHPSPERFGAKPPTRIIRATNENATPSLDYSQHAMVGENVILNGAECDMGGVISPVYTWTMVAPPGVMMMLTNPDKMSPSFTPEVAGDYVASLPTVAGVMTITVHVAGEPNK